MTTDGPALPPTGSDLTTDPDSSDRTAGAAAAEPRRVLVVIGTRPEAIKLAPVVRALRSRDRLHIEVVLTGQHTTLVDQVLDAFEIRPDFELGIMREGQSLYDVAAGCIEGLQRVVAESRPDLVLVQGDTATVFFASLVAFFERLSVGHVEAGLRSGRKWAPFPEEIFRRLTDQLTDLYFAPTHRARANLLREGVAEDSVFVTGNTVVDALLSLVRSSESKPSELVEPLLAAEGRMILLTAHRRESFGEPIRLVFGAVRELVERHPDLRVIYPVHPNPNVQRPAQELLGGVDRIHLTAPLGYTDLVLCLERADLILTDSGGIQEEAPTFGTHVLVLREVTERPEGVEAGVAELVGTDPDRILEAAERRLQTAGGATLANPYGDGRASERIVDVIEAHLTGRPRTTRDWSGE